MRNSSVFLSNCTIWVEGITDRRYLAHWLDLYLRSLSERNATLLSFKEDLHFSFVEYSGSNITHWSFLDKHEDAIIVDRLCGKLFLIADNDNAKAGSNKAERLEKLRSKLNDRFHQLSCREIENLLTPAVIQSIIQSFEQTNLDFKLFQQADYAAKGLGTFIETKIVKGDYRLRRKYSDAGGAIYRKVDFCVEALKYMNSFEELSAEAQELTTKLYNFILTNNRHILK